MKFLPLIWAALWRRPVRAVLTLLSVMIAFMLFGLMIALNDSFDHMKDLAHGDRIFVGSRFGGAMRATSQQEIARLPGVLHVTGLGNLNGYYQTRRNFTNVFMVDAEFPRVVDDIPLTPQQYGELRGHPSGIFISRAISRRWNKKAGDTFPITVPQINRADGSHVWKMDVLGIVPDTELNPAGYMVGNYKFEDDSRVVAERGRITTYRVKIKDPAQAAATAKKIDALLANSAVPTRSTPEKAAYDISSAGGNGIDIGFVTRAVAGAGLFMILFLTGNSIAQSVRERIPEFAVLKTIGFSDHGVMALVIAEAALPCLIGAGLGMGLAWWIAAIFPRLLPAGVGLPPPYMTPGLLGIALLLALLVAALSAAVPARRIARLDVAAALSGR